MEKAILGSYEYLYIMTNFEVSTYFPEIYCGEHILEFKGWI